jgi:hypothetical protein
MAVDNLLWRCPLCGTDDALHQVHRWRRPPLVRCATCRAEWQLLREDGHDYDLQLVAGPAERVGACANVAAWYREMKAGLTLTARAAPDWVLAPGEELYLQAPAAGLIVNDENPLLAEWNTAEAPRSLAALGEASLRWCSLGPGRLAMSSERLLWRGRRHSCDWSWQRVTSVFWFMTSLGVLYEMAAYRFDMPREHVLKWLTYAGELAPRIRERYGHRYSVSFY